jgi:hypothetical protein
MSSPSFLEAADAYKRIGADKVRNAQLPPKVVTVGGVALERPSTGADDARATRPRAVAARTRPPPPPGRRPG